MTTQPVEGWAPRQRQAAGKGSGWSAPQGKHLEDGGALAAQ